MAYQIPYQMLVPQGDAAHASMGTMDLGAIQRDRDWRQAQRNQLTTDVNDLNNKFANITAVNEEQAQLLAERKAYYDQQRQEILNGKGFITDKYNKIKLLGNQAANDPILSNVKQWTDAYNTNQLAINNIKNKDEDIAVALQKDLETRSKNPFVTHMSPAEPTTGTYEQGAVSTNKYNQYLPTTLTDIPDLGLDAQKFLKDAGTQELIQAGLRPMGRGQYLAINTNKILTEADALKQAADYIANSNKYQDFFNLKAQGRQLRGQSWTEAEKRKYIEDAVRGAALNARTNDYDVQNIDLTSNYTGPTNPTNPYDPNQGLVPGTPVGQEAVTVLQDSPKGFTGIEEYNQETQKRNNAYKSAKFKLQQYETGVIQATDAEIVKQKQLVKTLKQDYTLLASDKLAWEQNQIAKKGTVAPALQLRSDLKARGNLNSKGVYDVYANAKVYERPAKEWRAKQKAKFAHDIPGNSASEVFDIAEKVIKSKAVGWEKEIINMHKQALEDFTGDKYSETEFALLMGGAGTNNTVNSKYTKLMQSSKFLKASTLLRRAGATRASTTDMEDIFKKMFYDNITAPIQTGYDYHLKTGANFNPTTSTTQSMMQLPKIYKSVENAPAYEARVNFVGSFGDNLSKFHIVDNAGAALDEETAKTVKMQDVLAVGKAENGVMPVHFVGYTPETKKTKKRTGEYTLYVDINTNTAPKVQLQNFLKQANLSDPENNIVEGVLGSLNYTSNSNKIITDFKQLNPPTGTRKAFLPINGELESKKGWKQNIPELKNVPIVRTGETSYVIPDARQGSPYVAYYARLIKNKPEQTKNMINKVVKMTTEQQTEYFKENPQHMLVVTAAAAYQKLKENNFKMSFDSDEALQTYLDEVSRFYESVNSFD